MCVTASGPAALPCAAPSRARGIDFALWTGKIRGSVKIKLPWGESELEIELPAEWRVIAEANPKPYPPCASVEDEFTRAMAEPVSAAPLTRRGLKGQRIVIVVDDLTRPTPAHLFLPYLIRDLERAGARRKDLLMLVALGVHRPMSDSEIEQKVGRESLRELRWENHYARDDLHLVHLGQTQAGTPVRLNRRLLEADLIISVGSIEPHALAGFGGGLKNIVPGCAGAETIGRNHLVGASGNEAVQVGADPEANPLRRDLEEAASLLQKEVFLVNTVLDAEDKVLRIFTGHARLAHREGIRLARALYGVEVPEPADILITNSSPLDQDLRQGTKCIGNSLGAVKERGTILAFLRCRKGVGDFKLSSRGLPRALTKALVRMLSRENILRYLERFRKDLEIEEKFLAFYSLEILRRNEVLAYAPTLDSGPARRLQLLRLVGEPQEMIRLAAARAPRRPTVAIFPRGGITFPILSR